MSTQQTVTYRSLFAESGRLWFVSATALGRTTTAMRTLACILLVQQLTGSYGTAGLVGATQTIVGAVMAPVLARMIDARGERGVLFWAMLAQIIGVVLLISSAYSDLPEISMLVGAAVIREARCNSAHSAVPAGCDPLVAGEPLSEPIHLNP